MKRMLFNATQQEELRVAIVDGQKLIDIDIETAGREQRKSNIYKGVITRIEPSLEACFVNYGEERHGFLPFKEVARSYFREGVDVRNASIKEALREGQEIMVQVEKEERGNKGAALTSFISLAGRYLVLMPNNPRGGGVSRRVEGEDRQELRETMDKLDLPAGMSVIARTAGIGRSVEELQWDLNYLMQLWRAIEGAGQSAPGAFLIYQESSLVIRAIRDYFQPDIGEILIDTDDIHDQARQFMAHVMPDMVHRVKRYRDDVPLFSRFQIEHQIETAYSRTVPLPSGGAIVIDHTEALVSIDVNSARATRGSDIETTALNTNLEAADEVARQLRLRDLGGLIVIDFIDMENAKNQREVETRLKDALRYDRARVQMGKISRFGLMELSRQRLRPSLSEGSHVTCPRCNGTGHIRDTESSALQVLRIIQEEAMKENSAAIHVQAPVDVAAFLLNEKRGEILKIETRHRVTVILIPNKHLETPHYKLERIKHDDPRLEDSQPSYDMAEEVDTDIGYGKRQKEEPRPRQEAMVKGITPDQPAPIVERKPVEPAPVQAPAPAPVSEGGFFSRMFGLFRRKPVAPVVAPAPAAEEKPQQARERAGERNGRGGQRNRNRGRTGRERVEERDNSRVEAREEKQAQPVAAEGGAPAPRQPRPPRENREAGSESRRERPRREREPKENREPREAKEQPADALAAAAVPAALQAEDLAAAAVAAAAVPVGTETTAEDAQVMGAEGEAEAGAEGSEERRRRRRRGGRNRNRRDREGSELSAGGEQLGAEEGASEGQDTVQVVMTEATVQTTAVDLPASTSADTRPAVHAEVSDVSVQTTTVVMPAAEAPSEAAGAQPVEIAESAPATEAAAVEAAAVEPAVQPQVAAEAAAPAAVAIPAPQVAAATAAAEPETPRPSVEAAKPASTAPASMPVESLREVLAAAGLTLAMTDPEKLRKAQEAAAMMAPQPRIPRERKPLPPMPSEPLIQVETRQQA
ncbi:RNAse E [Noviherbaspirillum humi]|uniref:Ribonuclease E n=1 Tax=Noviherbaspirillum humi TaxID=1688639 RepID=A0A239GZJ3_9BURK|nr:Rne/Rng family ribonuclease [Noviherbaspirillum humi]SNS74636.1 RNAse E [Noviherbaspirillum humi]